MTTTPTKTMTTAELSRYLGVECEYEYFRASRWITSRGVLRVAVLYALDNYTIRNVRPILRRLADMTPEDAKGVFNAAFESLPVNLEMIPAKQGFRLIDHSDNLFIDIFPNGDMSAGQEDELDMPGDVRVAFAVTFNATAVCDYLDAKGYDRRGYLNSGAALPAEP